MDFFNSYFPSENQLLQKKTHRKVQKKPQPLFSSTGETACVFHHASDSFLQQDPAKALIHLPQSYLCRIVSNSAISIPILYYIIVRQT